MSKFEIKKGIESALGNGKMLLDIEFLGIGGAFDTDEGTSSALLKTRAGKLFLIDCGYSTYSKIRKKGLVSDVDRVFITHTHEDHINGLSTFVYERFYVYNKQTIIECTADVAKSIKSYLDLCGHPDDQYVLNTENHIYIEDEMISIAKVDTTAHHWPINNFPNSGLIFHFNVADDYAVFIYSGDINVPITTVMVEELYPFVYKNPDNVFIFHDMTNIFHEKNPHCNYKMLYDLKSVFRNLFTYHHNVSQISEINKDMPEMALTSLIIQGENLVIEEHKGL